MCSIGGVGVEYQYVLSICRATGLRACRVGNLSLLLMFVPVYVCRIRKYRNSWRKRQKCWSTERSLVYMNPFLYFLVHHIRLNILTSSLCQKCTSQGWNFLRLFSGNFNFFFNFENYVCVESGNLGPPQPGSDMSQASWPTHALGPAFPTFADDRDQYIWSR